MKEFTTYTVKPRGLEPERVRVTARPAASLKVTGEISEAAARELRVRLRGAFESAGLDAPACEVYVSAPGTVDVAAAAACLGALGKVKRSELPPLLGGLRMDGRVSGVRGVYAVAPRDAVVPAENEDEACDGQLMIATFSDLLGFVGGASLPRAHAPQVCGVSCETDTPPISSSVWESLSGVRRVLLVGPAGCGKTLVARRLAAKLGAPNAASASRIAAVYSVAGLFSATVQRPFRAPHHTVSEAGLLGGGTEPRPGEVSLAHEGVLFLDEVGDFRRGALEALDRVVDAGEVKIYRSGRYVTFPARPALVVGATTSCPCGYYGHPTRRCICTANQIDRWQKRLEVFGWEDRLTIPSVNVAELARAGGAS